jgi:hypothetical protein
MPQKHFSLTKLFLSKMLTPEKFESDLKEFVENYARSDVDSIFKLYKVSSL